MNDRKPLFATSDWHLGHAKVIELDARPFKDLEDMHRTLISRYNATVPKNGVCFFLGDIGWCSGPLVAEVLSALNGTKVCVLGNHDKNMHAMYARGFDLVLNSATIYVANKRVTMSHCPMKGVYREDVAGMNGAVPGAMWHGDHKQHAFTVADEGQFHLHGHIHSPNGGKSERILDRQFDVGVVANKYRPVSMSEIESWITKYGRK